MTERTAQRLRLALALALVAACWLGTRAMASIARADRDQWPAVQKYVRLPSPAAAPYAFLGYRQFGADVTWARALVYHASGGFDVSDYRYLHQFIDNIIALDPKFYRLYAWAAAAVTYRSGHATKDEFEASVRYLELGIKEFPNSFELLNMLGGRYWFDLSYVNRDKGEAVRRKLRDKALDYYNRAMHAPKAPAGYATFVASLHTKLGQRQRALQTLREMYLTTDDAAAQKKILAKFRYMLDDDDYVAAMRAAKREFGVQKNKYLPFVPAALFVLLGPDPDPAIDFDKLATETNLAGANSAAPQQPETRPGDQPEAAP